MPYVCSAEAVGLTDAVPPVLPLVEHPFIVCVGANPEPQHAIVVAFSQRPVVQTNPNRIDRFRGMDSLEVQAAVLRVFPESLICPPSLSSYRTWQSVVQAFKLEVAT